MARGDHARAVKIIKERNPFPTVIGRICPRPCENECRRRYVDEPVAINFLKRYAADLEKEQGRHIQPYKAPDTGRKVCVIGGGIEGLSTAFFSARLGHQTTVYEAADKMGGLLRRAIAQNRLPMDILDWDIEGITEMGVKCETGRAVGVDFSIIDLLAQGNHAVFLAVGGWDSRLARTQGAGESSPVPGCHLLIDILKSGEEGYPHVNLSGHTIMVGSPNISTAMVQRCKDLGAQKISVMMHTAAPTHIDVADAIVNGGISRIYGHDNRLTAVGIMDHISGEVRNVDCEHVVFASGRMPELIFMPVSGPDGEETAQVEAPGIGWKAIPPYKEPAYRQEKGLMAKGDVLTDFSAAIKAIAAGRRAAASIHQTMYGMGLELPDHVVTPDTPVQDVYQVSRVSEAPRQIMPASDERMLAQGAELEKGFGADQADGESNRCLQCGLICYLHESEGPQKQLAAVAG
jgi:NADPH-dependent glutamate synthase beta subunit-like oxidoreductase